MYRSPPADRVGGMLYNFITPSNVEVPCFGICSIGFYS